MRAGYAALFGAVLAYSAYQGIGAAPARNNSRQNTDNLVAGDNSSSKRSKSAASVEKFPTIASGISEVSFESGQEPCPDHKALCPASDLLGLIADYFQPELEKKNEADNAQHWNVPASERAQIEFVIASLPDPVHTHMALMFDREIETIEGAAQSSRYLFARSWMPWDISTHNESTDFTVRMAQQQYREEVEKFPGLMIFRRSGAETESADARKILFVFVTGERPTGGLQAEQFENALKIRKLIRAGIKDQPNVLRILGPTFSGSLASLHSILRSATWRNQFSSILIRSGSVSSYRAVRDFCELNTREWPQDPKKDPNKPQDPPGRPDFATFQLSDSYGEFFLNDFLNEQNRVHSHSQVAILSEDETAFGSQEPPKDESAKASDGCPAELPTRETHFVRLYFPREIAQLRDAYEREVKSQPSSGGTAAPPQGSLPLSLSTTGNDDDSVSPFSLQTPLSEESIMQGIVATLRKQHVRLILLRASDPLDVIFLVHFLRQNYPQGRLITVGADLLMIHDFYDPRFHGILALTSYPLLEGADFPWPAEGNTAGPPVHRLFPDSFQPGHYNAFLSLLAPAGETPKDELPAARYEQFGLPSFLQNESEFSKSRVWRAHVWLTAAGKDGYWPVHVLDEESNDAKPGTVGGVPRLLPSVRVVGATPSAPAPFAVHFSVSWTLFWMISFVLTIILALLLAFPPKPSTSSETLSRFSHVSQGLPGYPAFFACNRLLFFGGMLLLAMQTVFVFPSEVWLFSFGWPHKHGFLELVGDAFDGLPLVEGSYLLSVGFLAFGCARGFRKRGSIPLARAGAAVCLSAIVLNLVAVFYWSSTDIGVRFGSFLFRYINLGSGVSPSLPLFFLLAGWLWWCWHSLTGVTSTKEKHMELPDEAAFTESTVPGELARFRLRKISAKKGKWPWKVLDAVPWDNGNPQGIWSSTGTKILAGSVAGFAMIWLLMSPREIAESFETGLYRALDWVLLYSCLFLVCYLLAHIIALWLEFRNLTRAIERVPFRRGFGDLKNLTWKPLWKLAGSGRQEFVKLLGAEMDGLSQIQNGSWLNNGLLEAINEAQQTVDLVVATFAKSEEQKPGRPSPTDSKGKDSSVQNSFHDLQLKLAKVTAEGLILASQHWKQECYSPPITSGDENKAVESPATDPTLRAIEHFLCLFYVNVIMIPLRRLQTLILAMAGVFVFVLLSYSSYPFESRESFHVLLISIFFALSLVVGSVYGQMYTDPLLSRITNTKPGELGLDFWVKLGTFVFVPLLSLVSVQFPEVNNFLFSWLQPALQSIK